MKGQNRWDTPKKKFSTYSDRGFAELAHFGLQTECSWCNHKYKATLKSCPNCGCVNDIFMGKTQYKISEDKEV